MDALTKTFARFQNEFTVEGIATNISGKKTYLIATLGMLVALVFHSLGYLDIKELYWILWQAVLAMTLRAAIAKRPLER